MGHGGPDPRHVLRRQYENHVLLWGSNGPAEVRIMGNVLLDRAEVLMGARTEQGPDGNSYWVGAPGRHGHRLLAPRREYHGHTDDCLALIHHEGQHEHHQTQHSRHQHHGRLDEFERQETRDMHIVRDSWWERDMPHEHVMWRGHTTHEVSSSSEGPYGGGFTHHGYHPGHHPGHGRGAGYGYGGHYQQGINPPHHIGDHLGPYGSRNRPRHTAGSRFQGGFLHGREHNLAGPYGGGHHARYPVEEHLGAYSDDECE